MKINGVLLDTSFFIRFLNDTDPLFKNALEYYKYFLSKEIKMFISTISIAEYCVGGSITELPLRNLAILPFNLNHAIKTGEIAKIVFTKKGKLKTYREKYNTKRF
jgi:predicted nucleic acid-binding protein